MLDEPRHRLRLQHQNIASQRPKVFISRTERYMESLHQINIYFTVRNAKSKELKNDSKKKKKRARNIEMCHQITHERLYKKYWSRPWDISQNTFKHPHSPQISQVGKPTSYHKLLTKTVKKKQEMKLLSKKRRETTKQKFTERPDLAAA